MSAVELALVAERRRQLLLRSAALRTQLASDAQVLQTPLAIADSVHRAALWLRQHPEWPLGGLLLLAIVRPRRAWRWAARGWRAWRMWRRAQRLLALAAALV